MLWKKRGVVVRFTEPWWKEHLDEPRWPEGRRARRDSDEEWEAALGKVDTASSEIPWLYLHRFRITLEEYQGVRGPQPQLRVDPDELRAMREYTSRQKECWGWVQSLLRWCG